MNQAFHMNKAQLSYHHSSTYSEDFDVYAARIERAHGREVQKDNIENTEDNLHSPSTTFDVCHRDVEVNYNTCN